MKRLILAIALIASPLAAQQTVTQVRSNPTTFTAGTTAPLQSDTSGNLRTLGTDTVTGNVAAGATDSGNPVKVGAKYNSTLPTLTDGQRGDLQTGARGSLNVTLFAQDSASVVSTAGTTSDGFSTSGLGLLTRGLAYGFNGTSWDRARGDTNGLVVQPALSSTFWNYAAATGGIVNTTTAVTVKAAAGASVRNYLCTLTLNHDTLGAATEVAVRDGAAGTVLWRGKLQTTATDIATGAGSITFTPCLKGTANTLMEFVTLTAVTGGVFVNASGYTGS